MNTDQAPNQPLRTAASYLLAYGLWFVAVALSGFGILVMRSAINQWYVALELLPTAQKAVDRLFLYAAGAFWVFFIFYLEGYLRQGPAKGDLSHRLKRTFTWIGLWLLIGGLLFFAVGQYVRLFGY